MHMRRGSEQVGQDLGPTLFSEHQQRLVCVRCLVALAGVGIVVNQLFPLVLRVYTLVRTLVGLFKIATGQFWSWIPIEFWLSQAYSLYTCIIVIFWFVLGVWLIFGQHRMIRMLCRSCLR